MNKLQETYPQMCTVITDREYVTSEGRSMKILKVHLQTTGFSFIDRWFALSLFK